MIKTIHSIFVVWACLVSSVQAETFIRDYTYRASEADSKLTSRVIAMDQVKVILLQEIGIHIRQKINITKDGSGSTYASEDVEAITAGLTKLDILEEKWNGESYYLKAQIKADTERVLKALDVFKKDQEAENDQLESMRINENSLTKSRNEIIRLRQLLRDTSDNKMKVQVASDYNDQVEKIALSEMVAKGLDYYDLGQYAEALYWFKKATDLGSIVAQYNLGRMYGLGKGVAIDYGKAMDLFRKSAEKGESRAIYSIGVIYHHGYGVNKNQEEAVKYFLKSAELGDKGAQMAMGAMYLRGDGVPKNDRLSEEWFRKSAEQGFANAQSIMGDLYLNGIGVTKDNYKAIDWYRKAADQGYPDAQYNLGTMYWSGSGVRKDEEKAISWVRKAAEQDNAVAQYSLGAAYNNGLGVSRDRKLAKEWFGKACDNGEQKGCDGYKELY